jgi:hypothetical protein
MLNLNKIYEVTINADEEDATFVVSACCFEHAVSTAHEVALEDYGFDEEDYDIKAIYEIDFVWSSEADPDPEEPDPNCDREVCLGNQE